MSECYQCGTCASSCPVAKITERFNPRVVIKLWRFGDMNNPSHEFLSDDAIWLCCSCYNCQERCPQNIPVTEVMHWFRNLAVKKGYIPTIYSEFASALLNEARLVKVSRFAEKKRANLGLPPLQPTGLKALRKILSAMGFNKLQKKAESSTSRGR